MPSFYQKTIKNEIQFTGIGLHKGKKVTINLVPAPPNHGIVFKRTDLKKIVNIKSSNNIFDSDLDDLEHLTNVDRELLACYGAAKILTEGFVSEAIAIPNKSQKNKSGFFARIFNIFN